MNSFFNMIVTTIKYRFAAITTTLRYWTSKSFITTRVINRFRTWLAGLFHVKPRDKKDYYGFFGFLVSKRLVHVIVISIGLICLGYLCITRPFTTAKTEGGIKVYAYNSIPLRFTKGEVSIKAKKGYIAYTGQVSGGYAEGDGVLYDSEGGTVYSGQFSKNKYNGTGNLYYPTGELEYTGAFVDNLFQGNGRLYRSSGVLYYDGAFDQGYQHGQGNLYDKTGSLVFTGEFQRGELLYTQLLGKTTTEIDEMYSGSQKVYASASGDDTLIAMNDLSALYVASGQETSLEDQNTATMLYILRNVFVQGEHRIETVSDLRNVLGQPQYEGNSYIDFYDASAILCAQEAGEEVNVDTAIDYIDEYTEYTTVNSFDSGAMIYIYEYEINGLSYTFIASERGDTFFMYTISM